MTFQNDMVLILFGNQKDFLDTFFFDSEHLQQKNAYKLVTLEEAVREGREAAYR